MRNLLFAALALPIAACSAPTNQSAPANVVEAPVQVVPTVAPTTSAPIDLAAITGDTAAAGLKGELRCSFTASDGRMLLLAAGNVGPAGITSAVIQNGERLQLLEGPATGGFDVLAKGAAFTGGDLTLSVTLGQRQQTGTEETRNSAELTVSRQPDAARSYPGRWSCGP
ncbi:MAG: hypothetical protein V4808_03080 [Pseudomonadota bacterium]